jgi:hypothetical protein
VDMVLNQHESTSKEYRVKDEKEGKASAKELVLDDEGYAALFAIMARFGWKEELVRGIVGMVEEDGEGESGGRKLSAGMVRQIRWGLTRGGDWLVTRRVIGFIEEFAPETLESPEFEE